MLRTLSLNVEGKTLRNVLLAAGVLGLIWVLASWIVAGSASNLMYLGLGAVIVATVFSILKDWRSGFYLFLIWMLFEDLVRKYMGNNLAIYFGKDVLAGVAYLSFFAAWRRGRAQSFRPRFLLPFGLFFFLGLLQVFNPGSPSLLYGLMGLKLYFYYFPLLFLGYALLDTEKDLHRLLIANVALAGVIALLGIVQALVGPDFLNPEVLAREINQLSRVYRAAPITGEVVFRPSSVFVSDGRFAWYLILAWNFGLGTAGYLLLRRSRGRWLTYLGFALVTAAVLLSGSRGAVMWALGSGLIVIAGFIWGAPWRRGQSHRLAKAIRGAFLLSGAAVVCLLLLYPEAVGARWAFYTETLSPGSPHSELVWRGWGYPVQEFGKAFSFPRWFTGYGIGTASFGVQYVSRFLGAERPEIGVESGYGTLILELGILGPALWLAWVLALLRSGWQVVRRLRGTPYFPIGFCFLWFAFVLLALLTYFGMPFQNYILNAYLWILLGMLFRLPELAGRVAALAPDSPAAWRRSP